MDWKRLQEKATASPGHLANTAPRTVTASSPRPKRGDTEMGLDFLTGIANRRLFEYQGEKALAMAQRHRDDLGLVLFRLDNLEEVALRRGVVQAKGLLKNVAFKLHRNARSHDTVGRLSRSRFAMLLPGAREFGAHKFAVRLLSVLNEPDEGSEVRFVVSAAATATNSHSCTRFEQLSEHATERLDQAIAAGGNRVISSFCQ